MLNAKNNSNVGFSVESLSPARGTYHQLSVLVPSPLGACALPSHLFSNAKIWLEDFFNNLPPFPSGARIPIVGCNGGHENLVYSTNSNSITSVGWSQMHLRALLKSWL